MKRIISLFGSICLIATGCTNVVSCSNDPEAVKELKNWVDGVVGNYIWDNVESAENAIIDESANLVSDNILLTKTDSRNNYIYPDAEKGKVWFKGVNNYSWNVITINYKVAVLVDNEWTWESNTEYFHEILDIQKELTFTCNGQSYSQDNVDLSISVYHSVYLNFQTSIENADITISYDYSNNSDKYIAIQKNDNQLVLTGCKKTNTRNNLKIIINKKGFKTLTLNITVL